MVSKEILFVQNKTPCPPPSSLVNDLGGGIHGESKISSRPADEVVSIIKSRGGVAVPNYGMQKKCSFQERKTIGGVIS